MFAKPLRVKPSKDHLSVTYDGVVLAKVSKKILSSFLADMDMDVDFLEKKSPKKTKPKVVVIMETEIWPNLFYYCDYQQIPLMIANARLSEKSAKGYKKIKSIIASTLNQTNLIWQNC